MILEHPLSGEERSFLDSVAEFAGDEVMPHADQWDHDEKLPREIFSKAGKIGLMGMVVPKEYGGGGGGPGGGGGRGAGGGGGGRGGPGPGRAGATRRAAGRPHTTRRGAEEHTRND